jgi:hypothetical protein
MASQKKLFPFESKGKPWTVEEFAEWNPFALPTPPDILQLQVDTANVLEGRVDPATFTKEELKRQRTYYRFYGTRQNSKSHNLAKTIRSTQELI